MRITLLLIALLILTAVLTGQSGQSPAAPPVHLITIEGIIDPAMADYLERALTVSEESRAACLILRLDTPGGLGASMDKMTKMMLNSRLPVIVYVSPAGADALSAGTFITLAGHFAVMHPNSTIGAAHPRELFSAPLPEGDEEETQALQKQAAAVMEKITNAYAVKMRTIAETRGRNADWAELAVRESATVTSQEALELGVIDSLQPNLQELLLWLEGRTLEIEGRTITLHTRNAAIIEIPASFKDRFLHQLADPNLLLILLALAAMGILFELQNPGAILPGVVGGISLLLALYSISVLPVTATGLALIVFGLVLLILDIKVPSYGILSLGGVTAFIIGALLLIDTRFSGVVKMSWQVVIATAVLLAAFFVIVIGAVIRAHLRRPATGNEGMVGQHGRALSEISADKPGEVAVAGERWRARSQQGTIPPEQKVEVVAVEGLTLIVRPAGKE